MNAVAHADAVAHVACEGQAWVLLLQFLYGLETQAAVAPVLWNSMRVTEDVQQVGLHASRILQHAVVSTGSVLFARTPAVHINRINKTNNFINNLLFLV